MSNHDVAEVLWFTVEPVARKALESVAMMLRRPLLRPIRPARLVRRQHHLRL